jgi:transcriptional regulator
MYIRPQFEETHTETLHELMRQHPLGTLITLESGGLNAEHVPFEIDEEPAPLGTLRAHLPRANPVWRNASAEVDALVIFQGPQAYITPSWYATKQESGRVVPTYNFIVVHAHGPLRVIDDASWLRAHLERLTDRFENGREHPWKVSDAPDDFIEKLLPVLIGIEIPISKLLGKWKASQNQPPINRVSVERGLRESGTEHATAMADEIARRLQRSE